MCVCECASMCAGVCAVGCAPERLCVFLCSVSIVMRACVCTVVNSQTKQPM